jgi:hypothetical protein
VQTERTSAIDFTQRQKGVRKRVAVHAWRYPYDKPVKRNQEQTGAAKKQLRNLGEEVQ